jgi:ribonuclease P/MRP protein subunit POP5
MEALAGYAALGLSAAALAAAVLAARRQACLEKHLASLGARLRALEERLEGLEAETSKMASTMAMLQKALASALESTEAETLLEKLRRKRRRRYIVFQVVTETGETPPPEEVEKAVLRAVERFAGQLTVALSRIQLVYYHPDRGAGILRVSHDTKHLVLAALGLVRSIGGRKALIIPLRTTGTIKTAKRFLGLTARELKKT